MAFCYPIEPPEPPMCTACGTRVATVSIVNARRSLGGQFCDADAKIELNLLLLEERLLAHHCQGVMKESPTLPPADSISLSEMLNNEPR